MIFQKFAAERYEICQQCDQYRASTKTCKDCNCFLPAKTQLEMSSCPLSKWPGEVKPKSKAELERELANNLK